jgi:transcriptional regulator with XRE-family HTH domain
VAALAELAPDPDVVALALAVGLEPPAPARLGLPPGSAPLEPVRSAIRAYRTRGGSDASLLAAIDRHGDALEAEIARVASERFDEFTRDVDRLEALHRRIADLTAQAAWLRAFPTGPDRRAVPLTIELDGRRVAVPVVLAALRAVQLDPRLTCQGERPPRRRPGRRGAAASMAVLADAGMASHDVALAVGISKSAAYAMLNGHQPPTPELLPGLTGLLGEERAWLVIEGIPKHARARAPAGRAIKALHAAGVTTEDVAALIPVQPNSVRRWLNGSGHPSPKLAPALEQLLGDVDAAARIMALIPSRPRARAPASPALVALREAGVTDTQLAELIPTNRSTVGRWLAGKRGHRPEFATALEQLVDVDTAARIMSLIPH